MLDFTLKTSIRHSAPVCFFFLSELPQSSGSEWWRPVIRTGRSQQELGDNRPVLGDGWGSSKYFKPFKTR